MDKGNHAMNSGTSEIYRVEDVIYTNDKIHADLDEVLRCNASFDVCVEMAVDLLKANRELIDNPRHNFSILDLLIEHIESKIFFAKTAEELVFNFKHDRHSVKILNDAYCAWETALEQIFVMRLCSGSATSLYDYRLNNRFQRLLRREISMLRRPEPKRALFVGSGPFPISAIWLHRRLGIPVDGFDVSLDAIERSRELIDKLNLSHAINVVHEGAPSYDVFDYDVIIIALLAKPKSLILENIYNSAKKDCEIICRTSFGLRTAIYEPTLISHEILEKFSVDDAVVVSGNGDDTISSLLLKKLD